MTDFSSEIDSVLNPAQPLSNKATPNDFSAEIDQVVKGDKISTLSTNLYSAMSTSPEEATKQYQLSQQSKVPIEVLKTHSNEVKQMTEFNSIDINDIAENFPKVAMQLSDPVRVGAIRDDISSLSYFEKVFGSVKQEYKTAKENVASADLLLKQMAYDVSGSEKSKLSPLEENQLALIEDSQANRKDYNLGFISSIPSYTAAAIPTILSTIPQTLGGAAVGAAAGAAITKSPAGAAVGATWGSRAGTVYAAGKLETGLAYKELKDLVDENGKPIEKQVAAGGAIATGIVNGLIELVPFEAATGQVKKAFSREGIKQAAKSAIGREYLKNIGKLALAEGAAEGFQELSSVAFSEVAKAASTGDFALVGMKDANDTEGFYKFLSDSANRIWESTKAGAGAGLGLGGATGGVTAAKQVYDQRNKGKEESSQITDTVDKIKESKVFKRDPELFKEVTKDTLGEQNVYMPAEQVQTFFQTKTPEELEQFYQAVPEAKEQIQTALETGGDLVLPANSALTAIAQNPSFTELQKYMSLSPESMTEQQAQDTFLSNVSDTVNFEQKNQKEAAGQEAVKNNIKNQILDLNLPKNEAQNVITALTSYYDTKSARYGSQEAKKVLDTYLGSLEVKNAVFNRLQPMVKNTKVDELDKFINQARKFNPKKPTKPLLKFLKEKGGVKMDSNLAGELNALGITHKTAPGLFRKESGLGDVDNFPASEFLAKFPNSGVQVEGDYISRQAVLDLIGRELQGVDISKEVSQEEEKLHQFLDDLDRIGVEIKNSDNEAVKKAIESYKQEQGYFQTQDQPDKNTIRLYRGLEKKFDKNYPQQKTDAPIGYSTWTDNLDLAKQYAGQSGFIYQIDLPKSEIGKELMDKDGERVLFLDNKKGAGLNDIKGKEFLVYTDHELYNPDNIKEFAVQDQTKTEAFKKWFGDSKVVDEKGEPLVVYHGTDKNFEEFDKSKSNSRGYSGEKYGSFFTDNKKQAQTYASSYGNRDVNNARVIPAYLSIKNPAIANINELPLPSRSSKYNKVGNFINKSKKKGYDGVIIKGWDDFGGSGTQYIAFEPAQIKSVENKGTFDPENPNIYYQGGLGIIQKDQELALKSLDKFLKKYGIEAKTIQEKEKAYNNLKPSQKLELITSSINEAKINLDNYSDSKIYFQSGFGIIAADQERANAILDKFLKEEVGIEPKTPIERDEAFANLAPSEQLKIVEKQQKEIGESLTDYFGKRLFFQGGGVIQGQTQFIGQKPIISLFKSKNRSTLLHELGHVFLQIESEVSKLPDISDQVKNDWKTVEEWLGVKDGKITTEQHEKFARGFEAYLREGRAPSIGLRNAFRKFKSWLLKIYKNVKALDVEISEPVRKVFDRMLATDEEIENLKNNPLFRADQAILDSLSEEEQKKYLALTQNAKESAKEKLLSKSLKELSKQNTKSYKEEKVKVRAELEKQLSEAPVYRALNILKSPDYKLGRGSVENYDGDFLKRLPKDIIAEDGVDVDMAADYLGFKDGGEMLNSLAEAPSFKSELKNAVDEEMAARYVEPISEEDAINASENEARAKKILYELNNANKKVHTFVDTTENYKQKAKDILAKKEIKDATQSNIYYLNEVKAAREAGIAYGAKDYTKAVEWKKKQLLNHYLYRESQKIKAEVKDFTKRAERYKRKPVVGKVLMEEDYREKIIGLLQDFGIDAKGFDYQKTNIAELENWKKEQADEGVLGLVNFSEIAEFQDKDNIRALTTEQFKTLDNAVTNLAHVGQGLRSLEIEGKRVELEAIANDIVNLVNQNIKKDKPSLEDPTALEKLKRDFDSYASSLIKTSQTTLKIDGEKHLGAFYNYFEKNVNSSELKKEGLKDQAYKKFDEIFKKHFGGYNLSKKRTYFKDIGKSYSKPAVLSFALNWGNTLNRRRVIDGFEYSSSQVNSILSSLSKNELEFVQDVWDMINSYWPQVEATQKKLFGFAPKKQGAIPFTIKSSDGHLVKMKGGYYPIAYSKEASLVSDTKEDLQQLFAASAADKISFHASYTKERSEAKISKKIELSLNPLTKHISQVITDIAMKESVWNAYKIINNRKVSAALIKKIGLADYKQLQTWLYDMYGRSLVQEGALGKLAALSRSVATTYAMGFKVSTALIQITGLTNSIVKLGYGNMGYGIWKALGNGNPVSINNAAKLAFAKSKILEDRSKTINRDIYEVMDRLQQSGKMTKAIAKFAFLATTKAQMIVDLPTWYGGYYKGLKDFNGNEDKAVELADRLVIESQGSSYKQSRSSIERNEAAIVKAFTVFYSYMNVKLNLLAGSYRKNDFKKPRDVATFASDLMLLFFVDAVATEFLREGVSNLLAGRDDEDDDEENKTLHYANLITQSAASTIPGVSQFYSGLSGYSFNPGGFKGFEIVGKGVKNLGSEAVKAISEDEEADLLKALRGLNDTLAIFSAGGGGQIDIFLRAEQDAQKGNDVAPIDYLLKAKK